MAKAVGAGGHVPIERERAPRKDRELMELAARLEDLARAQEEARGAVSDGEPNCAAAFERLFAAVTRLNPLYATSAIRTLAQSSVMPAG